MKKHFRLFPLLLFITIGIAGCASSLLTDRQKFPQTERRDPSYTWSSFFNNDCGPQMEIKVNGEDDASLIYQCSNGKEIRQYVRRHQRLNEVELWAASDLPVEQLYRLSNGKCRASLIYLGPVHATIKFPCALIHLTVTCDIVSRETLSDTIRIQLKPRKALVTYSDGIQEFNVKEERLTPRGPFKPFKTASPSFTHNLKMNQILTVSTF